MNGVRLHYVVKGTGQKLVVLLHGFPEFWYTWHAVMDRLASQGYKVVAIDMRGYNDSERPFGIHSYLRDKLSSDILGLVAHLGHAKCTLVAHDWGGVVAWDLARRNPEILDHLVVLNSPHPLAYEENMNFDQAKKVRASLDVFSKFLISSQSWYFFAFAVPLLPELVIWSIGFKSFVKGVIGSGRDMSKCTQQDLQRYTYGSAL